MISYPRALYEIARKEALQHLRTKRLLIFGGILLLVLVLLTIVVPLAFFDLNDFGDSAADNNEELYLHNGLFALFLIFPLVGGIMILTILSITLTADSVCSEWQRKTIFLVLSKPVDRSAFVLGKFLGSVVPLAVMFIIVALVDYVLIMIVVGDLPGGEEMARLLGGLGMISLGIFAYGSLGLFFSTLTRSSVPSFIFSFLVAIIVLPMLTVTGTIMYQLDANDARRDGGSFDDMPDPTDWKYEAYRYLDPGSVMSRSVSIMLPDDAYGGAADFFGGGISRTTPAILSAVLWSGLFLGLSLLSVNRRNFE